jgi:hypothetical protein
MQIAESGECTSLTDCTQKMNFRPSLSCFCLYKTKLELQWQLNNCEMWHFIIALPKTTIADLNRFRGTY